MKNEEVVSSKRHATVEVRQRAETDGRRAERRKDTKTAHKTNEVDVARRKGNDGCKASSWENGAPNLKMVGGLKKRRESEKRRRTKALAREMESGGSGGQLLLSRK